MATWVRSFSADLTGSSNSSLVGPADLDNDAPPSDFNPAAVNSVRFQFTLSHTGTISDDSWALQEVEIETTGGTQIASVNSSGTLDSGNSTVTIDLTDATVNNGLTETDWQDAQFNGTGTNIATFSQSMGPDGAAARILASSVTITIDYDPDLSQSIEVGGASETEAVNAVTLDLSGLVGKATEVEAAGEVTVAGVTAAPELQISSLRIDLTYEVASSPTILVNKATETESANAVTRLSPISVTVGKASETETANVVARLSPISIAVGSATEAEAAVAVARLSPISIAIGVATETETSGTVTPTEAENITVGKASETETANAVTIDLTVLVDKTTETETANAVQANQSYPVGQASEIETANAIAINRSVLVGKATETETANTVEVDQSYPVGKATETETANAVTMDLSGLIGKTTETETANAVTIDLTTLVGKAVETETAETIIPSQGQNVAVGSASESETANTVLIVDVPELEGYRFRNDDGSEATASWKDSQDIAIGINVEETFRLRTLVNHSGDPVSGALTLQYKRSDEDDTEWRDI